MLAAAAAVAGTNANDREVRIGPFFSSDTDVDGNMRVRALGPVYEKLCSVSNQNLSAVRPLYSFLDDPDLNNSSTHLLWPAAIGKTFRHDLDWRVLLISTYHDFNVNEPDSRYRFWILPFYFQGRGTNNNPYVALFPIAGKIDDGLYHDRIWFVLFPLYSYSRVEDYQTYCALWPVFARGWSEDWDKTRVFPFYGYTRRRTDFIKRFIMWPVWNEATYGFPESSGTAWFLTPVMGHVDLSDQESWALIPPLIRFSTRGRQQLIYAPWPVFQYARGITWKFYIWPLAGWKDAHGIQTSFAFWPFAYSTSREHGRGRYTRSKIAPVVFCERWTETRAPDGKSRPATVARTFKFWPLVSFKEDRDRLLVRMPSICPFRDYPSIDRNYAPFWTLFTHAKNGEEIEDEFMWGLFQSRRGPARNRTELFPLFFFERNRLNKAFEWSLLKGLFARSAGPGGNRYRLLWAFSWGGDKPGDKPQE